MDKIKGLYFEADTRKHQQLVNEGMVTSAKMLLDRGLVHDVSKLTEVERQYYEEPVWRLNHDEDIAYGSAEYKELTALMGKGLTHHKAVNDHHPEFYELTGDPSQMSDLLSRMNMFALIEMLCDWIAASKRKGGNPAMAMKFLKEKYDMSEQLEGILLRTLTSIEEALGVGHTTHLNNGHGVKTYDGFS